MNEMLLALDLGGWKPLLTALLLPPLPWLLPVVAGAALLRRRRAAGWTLVLAACAGLWLSATWGAAEVLTRTLLTPPPALAPAGVAALRQSHAAAPGRDAIVVLGGGRESLAPEYDGASLAAASLERLRYGVWLARATGIALVFSGGVGHAAHGGPPEADVAARIAATEFGHPVRWVETRSRDTRENATYTLQLLRGTGIRRIVVVTHGWHAPRALRAFEAAAHRSGERIELVAAPMGLAAADERPVLRWLPTTEGQQRVRHVLREWLGWVAGA